MRKKYFYIINKNSRDILEKYHVKPENPHVAAVYSDVEYWELISKDFKSSNVKFIRVELEFSKDELNSSEFLKVRSIWHWGYPQPENSFEEFTYGKGNFCDKCGAKFLQVKPFKIKKAPSWRNKHFLQLNWVDDELFVKRETYDLIKKDFEQINYIPVVTGKENKNVDNIVQINVEHLLESGYINKDATEYTCELCGIKKHFARGENKMVYKKEIFKNATGHIYRSNERFGAPDLHVASRNIIISNELYKFLHEKKLGGELYFEPLDLE